MFTLRKKFKFEASHQLPNHDGKCQRLHGHSWVGWIEVQGPSTMVYGPKAGMLMDYGDLAKILDPIVEGYLDHLHLNESTSLKNPTSEELAKWLYQMLSPKFPEWGPQLVAVVIEETCTSYAEYRP